VNVLHWKNLMKIFIASTGALNAKCPAFSDLKRFVNTKPHVIAGFVWFDSGKYALTNACT
jgi:hypothetical protein